MTERRRRGVLVLLLTAGLSAGGWSAAVALARPGVVKTTDGQTYEGEIATDDADANVVIVTVRGIPVRLDRSRIASLTYSEAFEKEFAGKMAKLKPDDVPGRLALARDALNQKQYALAREAAEGARAIDPNSADAVAMLETIRSQMRLDQSRPATPREPGQPATGGATRPATTEPASDQNVLKPADINAIRQVELRPDDRGVRIRYERDLARRYPRYANLQPAQWGAMTDNEKVQRILTDGTPEMRRDVQILNDPPAMFQFRRQVQPWVIQNCATSGCHGGASAEKFSLVQPSESDAATYTNFYILQRYQKAMKQDSENVFGRGDLRMVDRQRPEQSLLLQYALPGSIAEQDHPDVPNYKPALRNVNDPRYRLVLDWVSSIQPVEPDYGIVFDEQDRAARDAARDAAQNASWTTQAASQPATDKAPATKPARPAPTTRPAGPVRRTTPVPGRAPGPPAR